MLNSIKVNLSRQEMIGAVKSMDKRASVGGMIVGLMIKEQMQAVA